MKNAYQKYSTGCESDYITCTKCSSSLHFKSMQCADITKTLGYGNKHQAYILSIIYFKNIMYLFTSCKPNFCTNKLTPISQMISNILSNISVTLDDIKNIVDNTYINTNTNKNNFADALIHFI